MRLASAASVFVFLLAQATASASPIGILGLGSSGGVTGALGLVQFLPDPSATPPGPPWNAEVNNNTTLTFTGGPLNVGEGVEINNNAPLFLNAVLPIDNFFRFAAHPLLDFELTGVVASGAQTNCQLAVSNGQSCSLLINGSESPIVLQANGSGGTVVSLTLQGLASDTGVIGPNASNWVGSFSPTIPNLTPLQIAQFLCPNYIGQGNACTLTDVGLGRSLTITSNSGSFTASAPEPGTLSIMLLGTGMIACATLLRRFSRR
jgi:hypothetical protein